MRNKKVTFIVQASMIAAIYVVLTIVFAAFSYGEIQIRIAEALTILPFFTPAAIPGLFIGCVISNMLGGCVILDVIGGAIATLLGAAGSYLIRRYKYLVPLPPIIINALIVPFVLRYGYGVLLPIPFMMLTVGIGEIISCGILGTVLLISLNKYRSIIFRNAEA